MEDLGGGVRLEVEGERYLVVEEDNGEDDLAEGDVSPGTVDIVEAQFDGEVGQLSKSLLVALEKTFDLVADLIRITRLELVEAILLDVEDT